MIVYILLLIIAAVIAYGMGSLSSVTIASMYVFRRDLRKLDRNGTVVSNFRRVYGVKGAILLLLVELVRDVLPILIGGWLLGIKGHADAGRVFAAFCLVMGRLFPVFYDLKGSHAIICLIVAAFFVKLSAGIAVLLLVGITFALTRWLSLSALAGAFAMVVAGVALIDDRLITLLCVFMALAVLIKHIPAISRMINGKELKISFDEDITYKLDNRF